MLKKIFNTKAVLALAMALSLAVVLAPNTAQAAAPTGSSAAMTASSSTTVTMTVTGTDFDQFVSAQATTANATDRAKITYKSQNPTAAVITNSTTLTLTFDLSTLGTGKSGSLTIAAGAVEDASNAANLLITVADGSVTDSAPPRVISVSPADEATNVNRGASFVVTFSEPMTTASLTGAFSTAPTETYTPTWSAHGTYGSNAVVTLAHGTLKPARDYVATITTAVTDAAAGLNALAANYEWNFTTKGATSSEGWVDVDTTPVSTSTTSSTTTTTTTTTGTTTPAVTTETTTTTTTPTITVTPVPVATAPVVTVTFTQNLAMGAKGDAVIALQAFLVKNGYLTMPQGVAYGYFGGLTKAAILKFQMAKGVVMKATDGGAGMWGPKTRAAASVTASASANAN